MPPITEQLTIDGYSQPGASVNTAAGANGTNATIGSSIDGNDSVDTGFDFQAAPNSIIRGLAIFGFSGRQILAGPNTTITGNFLGLDAGGGDAYVLGNGVDVNGASGTTIGGPAAADRNVIGGLSTGTGISVFGSNNVTISNNLIGLTPGGNDFRRLNIGVSVENSSGVLIGGGADSAGAT